MSLSILIYNSLVLWHWGCPTRETAVTYKAPSISKKIDFRFLFVVSYYYHLQITFSIYFTNHSIHCSTVSLRIHLLTFNPFIRLTCFSTENLQLLVKRSSNISVSWEAKMLIYSWLNVMENPKFPLASGKVIRWLLAGIITNLLTISVIRRDT